MLTPSLSQLKRGRPRKDSATSATVHEMPLQTADAVNQSSISNPSDITGSIIPEIRMSVDDKAADDRTNITETDVQAVSDETDPASIPSNSVTVSNELVTRTATPRPAIPSQTRDLKRPPVKVSTDSYTRGISITAAARQGRILQLLRENNGVIEGGRWLEHELRNNAESSTGVLDRKTIGRDVSSLVDKQMIKRICISVLNSHGSPVNVWILSLSHLDVDSPEVEEFRNNLTGEYQKKQKWKGNQEVITDDFSFYQVNPASSKRAQMRVQQKAEKAMLSTKLNQAEKKAASERLKKRIQERQAEEGAISFVNVGEGSSTVMPRPKRGRPKVAIISAGVTDKTSLLAVARPSLKIPKRGVRTVNDVTEQETHSHARETKSSEASDPKTRKKRTQKSTTADPLSEFMHSTKKPRTTDSEESKRKRAEQAEHLSKRPFFRR